MSYRIDYQAVRKIRGRKVLHARMASLTMLCFLIFIFLSGYIWPEAVNTVKNRLFNGKDAIMVSALDIMAENLGRGEAIALAVKDFWWSLVRE